MSENLFPRLFLFGAPRCATSTLYAYLQTHPDIFFPALKEPRFFSHPNEAPSFCGPGDAERANTEACWEEAAYLSLYAGAGEVAWRGDATSTYLADVDAGRRIKEYVPDPRFIAILRNPVERAYSCYTYKYGQGLEEAKDFEEALALESKRRALGWAPIWHYIHLGFYARQISAYLDMFPAESFRFYLYDSFVASPELVLEDIYRFLALKQEFHVGAPLHYNAARLPPPVGQSTRILRRLRRLVRAPNPSQGSQAVRADELSLGIHERLTELFADDLEMLEDLIHLDLSAWRNVPKSSV